MDFWIIDIKDPPYQGIIFPLEFDSLFYVSEFLQPTENIWVFGGFRICPGNGIMEWWPPARRVAPTPRRERWNIGFQKDVNHFYFISNPAAGEKRIHNIL
jgi:hypothetical protein